MRAGIETRPDPRTKPTLDALSRALGSLGWHTFRWHNDNPPLPAMRSCDLVVMWNGAHPIYAPIHAALPNITRVLYVELGWLPQDGTFQIDPVGINSRASWVPAVPTYSPEDHLHVRDGDLLVVLQCENDMQIRELSPYKQMAPWVHMLAAQSALPLRVRPHPKAQFPFELVQEVCHCGVTLDESDSVESAFEGAAAVATINSTCGLQAIEAGLPVLCYGEALYRQPYVCYCMDGPDDTHKITTSLKAKDCHLCPEAMRRMVGMVREHQWTIADLPDRLGALLKTMEG